MSSIANLATQCRFAVLEVSDGEEDESSNKTALGGAKTGKNTSSETTSGKSKKKKKRKKNKGQNDQDHDVNTSEEVMFSEGKQEWQHWKNKDDQYVLDQFQKDLQTALEASRSELVGNSNIPAAVGQEKASVSEANRKERRKGLQKKDKPVSMSLDEFVTGSVVGSNDKKYADADINGHSLTVHSLDDFYFEPVIEHEEKPLPTAKTKSSKKKSKKTEVDDSQTKDQTSRSEQKNVLEATKEDEMQAEFVKNVQIQDELEKKTTELKELRKDVVTIKAELAQVKKRNKQLCHILGQGEMREKSELLLQIEDLNEVKDELTNQVTSLHTELEQERSKLHAARTELTKLQYGQSGGKTRHGSTSAS